MRAVRGAPGRRGIPLSNTSAHIANKLPEITLAFWIMKICATTLGETAGDLLSMTLDVGYAASSLILITLFLTTLGAQLAAKRHHPALYWLVILSTSTAGTTISDYMDRTLGVGYSRGTAILMTLLCFVLVLWKLTVGSLSVDRIRSRKAEIFYWTAILISNTLGTALGDFLADESGLGFAGGALLVGGLLAVTAAAFYFTRVSRIALFWIAFVSTRPFGATFGDLMTKTHEHGGLDIGTVNSSLVLAALLISVMVVHHRRTRSARAPNVL